MNFWNFKSFSFLFPKNFSFFNLFIRYIFFIFGICVVCTSGWNDWKYLGAVIKKEGNEMNKPYYFVRLISSSSSSITFIAYQAASSMMVDLLESILPHYIHIYILEDNLYIIYPRLNNKFILQIKIGQFIFRLLIIKIINDNNSFSILFYSNYFGFSIISEITLVKNWKTLRIKLSNIALI